MEAVRPSQMSLKAPPAEPAAPKLSIEKFADGGITCLKFVGTIDEGFEGKKLGRAMEGETLILDLGGVKKISSFGIREWVDFIGTAGAKTRQILLIECAPKVVDQLNMVANFAGGGRVFSFYAPFRCDYCDSEHRVLLDLGKDYESLKALKLAERPCPSCKESMYFDEDGSTYFSYVLGQGTVELEPDVVAFLAAKLDYRVGTIDAKLRVDKIIEGRVTYLRLAGGLDNTFPRDKLAEGLEGTVIVDVGGVSRVEPAGAAEWRSFVQAVTPLVDQLLLVGVQPAFLEKLCSKDDLGPKTFVVDFTLPYACGSCGTTNARPIDVAEHHDVIKFATAPELRCPSCKHEMQCQASEAAMTLLPGLPKPAIDTMLGKTIDNLRARKLDKKPSTGLVSVPRVEAAPRSSPAVPILLGLLVAVVLAGAAVFVIRGRDKHEAGPYGIGPVVKRSETARPAWISDSATPGTAACSEAGGGLTCVGVSTISASQEDAEDEASDAAIEAAAYELGKRIGDDAWKKAVSAMYLPARDAKLAALARDAQSTQARRDVREARHAVALALRGATPSPGARYWEAFDPSEGRRFVAFSQVTIAPGDAKQLLALYTRKDTALGATVMAFFPELAWRYPRLSHGATIVGLAHGVLQDLGLAEHYIILGIDGRDVSDAQSFARSASEEYTQLSLRGGSFRVLVQTDTGDPREFATQLEGNRATPTPPEHGHGHGTPDHGTPTPGGVNVWDRFGGSRGSGRDDPTQ
jgi:anti-anti-sigma regulatory factor